MQAGRDVEAVLAANASFYVAFSRRDPSAMDALWAQRSPVACIHPGWAPLHGRDAVMRSWAAILAGPQSPEIACHSAQVYLHGECALVICTEVLAEGNLVATNVFVREDSAWRLVHHQAGPAPAELRASRGSVH